MLKIVNKFLKVYSKQLKKPFHHRTIIIDNIDYLKIDSRQILYDKMYENPLHLLRLFDFLLDVINRYPYIKTSLDANDAFIENIVYSAMRFSCVEERMQLFSIDEIQSFDFKLLKLINCFNLQFKVIKIDINWMNKAHLCLINDNLSNIYKRNIPLSYDLFINNNIISKLHICSLVHNDAFLKEIDWLFDVLYHKHKWVMCSNLTFKNFLILWCAIKTTNSLYSEECLFKIIRLTKLMTSLKPTEVFFSAEGLLTTYTILKQTNGRAIEIIMEQLKPLIEWYNQLSFKKEDFELSFKEVENLISYAESCKSLS